MVITSKTNEARFKEHETEWDIENLLCSNDSMAAAVLKDELTSGSSLDRAQSIGSAAGLMNSSDSIKFQELLLSGPERKRDQGEASFIANLMKDWNEEDRLAKSADLSFLKSGEIVDNLLRSSSGHLKAPDLQSATIGTSILKDDAHNIFSSRDWLPEEDARQQIDDSLVAKYFQTVPSSEEAREFLGRQFSLWRQTSQDAPRKQKQKTDWNHLYEINLPPVLSQPAADVITQEPPILKKDNKKKKKIKNRKRPSYDPEEKLYVEPTDEDVLFGRGGRSNHHPGNKCYHSEKQKIQQRYMTATKDDKTTISQELVDIIHGWGGRFLRLEDGTKDQWYEVLPIAARKKVSQALRELNTPDQRQLKRTRYRK
jgi:hypothetical protein